MSRPERDARNRADRALELHDKGLKPSEIAERLGVYPRNVGGMLQRARDRRAKMAGEVVE